ncbi:MAG TPA: ABC transporter ATP-binding protein [Chthoniobacterales bacterium]
MSYITFNNVSKAYARGNLCLDNIDMGIDKGEFVSIIGPSGCGKSTLLKLVSSLSPVTSGSITVDGMTPANAREIMSFIFQDPTLLPWRTVEGNIGLGLELEGFPNAKRHAKVESLLALVGLAKVGRKYPRELSGGMKMRVSIARALATTPKVLLLDEPFAALDEMTRDRLNEELLRLRDEARWTALFVTHSVSEAVFLSTRIIVLAANPGRIAHDIPIRFPYPRGEELRLSPEFESTVTEVSRALRAVQKL